jgi:hypothetical protein
MDYVPPLPSRIDSEELRKIKSLLSIRQNINAERFETNRYVKSNPSVIFDASSNVSNFSDSTLRGLSYPLKLDGNGGLALSSNMQRVEEQIREVLETRIGERIYRQYFGIPDVLFETISENILAETIKSRIQDSIPIAVDLNIETYFSEDGTCSIIVQVASESGERGLVKYSFNQ